MLHLARFTALSLPLALPGCAQLDAPVLDRTQRIDNMLEELTEEGEFAGAVLVAEKGTVLLRRGYGMADIDAEVPNTHETQFHLCSVSKLLTRCVVLQAVREERLDVDDLLAEFVPDWPDADLIRIRNLLNHTAGIPDAHNRHPLLSTPANAATPLTRAELTAIFQAEPPHAAPGTRHAYSSPGYTLLAWVLEEVYGEPFPALMQRVLFGPLGMGRTSLSFVPESGWARTYRQQDGVLVDAPRVDFARYIGAAAVHSTVDDLYAWYRAAYRGDLLGGVATGEFALGSHYGHGWGSTTGFYPMPSEDLVVIVLSNLEHAPVPSIIPRIYTILLEDRVVELDPARADQCVGRYRQHLFDDVELDVEIRRRGNRLQLQVTIEGRRLEVDLLPEGVDRYLTVMDGEFTAGRVTFRRNDEGSVVGFVSDNAGLQRPAERLP